MSTSLRLTAFLCTALTLGGVAATAQEAAKNNATRPAATPERKPDIHFVPTPQSMVDEMLTTAKVGKDDLVYDLGCGDGRIVITAVSNFGARGIGIDIDPQRIDEATASAEKAGVTARVAFKVADIFKSNFSDASVIALYLLNTINEKLRPKILAETKPGTRVVSHAFSMGVWRPDAEKTVDGRHMYFWVVPANLSGTWQVTGDRGATQTVTLQQKFQDVTGTFATEGGSRTLTGVVTGEAFTLKVEGEPAVEVTGRISGDRIEATTSGQPARKWSAVRQNGTKGDIGAISEPVSQ